MVKTKGLRPPIEMHLDRRGGRRYEKKIVVKDIDGAVPNLRQGLPEDDLKVKKKTKTPTKSGNAQSLETIPIQVDVWAPAHQTKGVGHKDALRNGAADTSSSWKSARLPRDFPLINFTESGEGARGNSQINDAWIRDKTGRSG